MHSHEYSGNPKDGDRYSPYSIGVADNFDLWCGEELPFLVHDVLGSATSAGGAYVALHGDFNATGLSSLVYGDAFAALSTEMGGPQNCTLFGNANSPCTLAVGGLPAIGDPMTDKEEEEEDAKATTSNVTTTTTTNTIEPSSSPTSEAPTDAKMPYVALIVVIVLSVGYDWMH